MAERAEGSGDTGTPQLTDLEGVSNVLVMAPAIGAPKTDACMTLLTQTPPARTNVLSVTFVDSPTELVTRWDDVAGSGPARGGIVAVGQSDAGRTEGEWRVATVENPSDLTGIGIELSELLSRMAESADDDEPIVVCFDSITSLLQYADLQRTFRFLHVVTGRVKTVGGVGHFHVDPEAHSNQDIATLKGLFDAVVEVDDEGELAITR
ncbi:MAG: hypothetical protein ABEH64_13660 [Salinirussus sp.]